MPTFVSIHKQVDHERAHRLTDRTDSITSTTDLMGKRKVMKIADEVLAQIRGDTFK